VLQHILRATIMSLKPVAIPEVSPYRRIRAAGFEVAIKSQQRTYRLLLVQGDEVVARIECPRNGNVKGEEALAKAKLGQWTPVSGVYKAMAALADVAEVQATAGA
jgi:hypothetical protein